MPARARNGRVSGTSAKMLTPGAERNGGTMFYCERCGTRFNAAAASSASNCPRCRARDGVAVPLSFRLFEVDAVRSTGVRPRRIPPTEAPTPAAK